MGWLADQYLVRINERPSVHIPYNPLFTLENPLFPDAYRAIKNRILDLSKHDGLIGKIIILLPNYRARIKEVQIKSRQLDIEIETREIDLNDLLGKVWCEGKEGEETQEDINFDNLKKTISLEYTPKDVYIYLFSKSMDEAIDYYEKRSSIFEKEMRMDMTTDEILELIKEGENQKVEFKEEVEPNKLAKELVAFANTNDGLILIGVDNERDIKGVNDPRKSEEKIMNIAQENCNPSIYLETREYNINNEKIIAIFVPQGKDKPYQQKDNKRFFVRRGSTSRPTGPTEIREITTVTTADAAIYRLP